MIASGTITGLDKQVFNCPGGGHGELVLEGSYQPPAVANSAPVVIKTADGAIKPGDSISVPLPTEPGGRHAKLLRHSDHSQFRRNSDCEGEVDR